MLRSLGKRSRARTKYIKRVQLDLLVAMAGSNLLLSVGRFTL